MDTPLSPFESEMKVEHTALAPVIDSVIECPTCFNDHCIDDGCGEFHCDCCNTLITIVEDE
ncbi:hypothetical protein [uncultured Photobacterium sp.]|uniref:hypothetical protein n=1 Tax=uncultured Photobacterium sp. TaxID=173973 RepID=UPI00260E5B2A|nr:hypothetical protein [uncultured Photobacterium sp.]